MWRYYLKVSCRNLLKFRGFAVLNIIGLSASLLVVAVILLFVSFQYSYDNFHEDGDNVYRVRLDRYENNVVSFKAASASKAVGPAIKNYFPEIIEVVRFADTQGGRLWYNDEKMNVDGVFHADPEFNNVFSFPFLQGDQHSPLPNQNSIVISESLKQKIFGEDIALGEIVRFKNSNVDDYFTVSGVFKDIPKNSHISFECLIPFTKDDSNILDWYLHNYYTYILVPQNLGPSEIESKFPDFYEEVASEGLANNEVRIELHLQKLEDIHLYSHFNWEIQANGNPGLLVALSVVGITTLLLAWFNHLNFNLALTIRRTKETGIKKVLGSGKKEVIIQSLFETTIINLLAVTIAGLIIRITWPSIASLGSMPKDLVFHHIGVTTIWLLTVSLIGIILVGLLPTILIIRTDPINTNTNAQDVISGSGLRKSLVLVQFIISTTFILFTLILVDQTEYMISRPLGFEKKQVLVIRTPSGLDSLTSLRSKIITDNLTQLHGVASYTVSSTVPGDDRRYFFGINVETNPVTVPPTHNVVGIDKNYFSTFKIKLAAGRMLTDGVSDRNKALINETSAKALGFVTSQDALHKKINWFKGSHEIVGVIKDYHQRSLNESIEPMLFIPGWTQKNYYFHSVRLNPGSLAETLPKIESYWRKVFPEHPFDSYFLDNSFDSLYADNLKLTKLFGGFTFFAMLIAALGLLGSASFSCHQRIKEISIRKVLGASTSGILYLLNGGYIKLAAMAFSVSLPLGYYLSSAWLQQYPYRIEIKWTVFLISIITGLLIMFFSTGYQVLKAAIINPANTLRNQ